MPTLNATHDPKRRSFVPAANADGADFPIQNLPFGAFAADGARPRVGVAIGDRVLDIAAARAKGLFADTADAAAAACEGESLNALMALGPAHWSALRARLSELLSDDGPEAELKDALIPMAGVTLHVPAAIGDYTDFYASINHATNAGRTFRPDNPLLPNYKYVPIAYHGRASSIRASGTPVRRPVGQVKPPDAEAPMVKPAARLDYEMELGLYIGPGNSLGTPIPLAEAENHAFGMAILNDWSARDIQAWEYQPLGPFLAKSFASTVSPWVVTMEALAPFRTRAWRRPEGDPAPLPYLAHEADETWGGLDIAVEVAIATEAMRAAGTAPQVLGRASFREMYWTVFQMIAHHTMGGCDLRPGDFLGSGTISGTTAESYGSLLELTQGGKAPITLASGETRTFLEDGDEVIMRARCERTGHVGIGFGACRAVIEGAKGSG